MKKVLFGIVVLLVMAGISYPCYWQYQFDQMVSSLEQENTERLQLVEAYFVPDDNQSGHDRETLKFRIHYSSDLSADREKYQQTISHMPVKQAKIVTAWLNQTDWLTYWACVIMWERPRLFVNDRETRNAVTELMRYMLDNERPFTLPLPEQKVPGNRATGFFDSYVESQILKSVAKYYPDCGIRAVLAKRILQVPGNFELLFCAGMCGKSLGLMELVIDSAVIGIQKQENLETAQEMIRVTSKILARIQERRNEPSGDITYLYQKGNGLERKLRYELLRNAGFDPGPYIIDLEAVLAEIDV
ncbi:hypothetical protein ACFL0Z_03235 [Patescibacteria group bacterium]